MREQHAKIIRVAPGVSSQTTTDNNHHSRKVSQSPRRTNDVDTDKRRRTLQGVPAPYPLTFGVIEASHDRTFIPRWVLHRHAVEPMVHWL